jgi:DNA-binding MarR family transcriptional regulator
MTGRTVSGDDALGIVIAMHRLLRRLRRAGDPGGVHPTQLIVLALLNQYGPLRVGEIARRVPCSQPTATTAVAGLLSAGLVDREADPTDGRATRVVATPAGVDVLRSVTHGEAEVLAVLLSRLPEEEARLVLTAGPVLSTLVDLPVDGPDLPEDDAPARP